MNTAMLRRRTRALFIDHKLDNLNELAGLIEESRRLAGRLLASGNPIAAAQWNTHATNCEWHRARIIRELVRVTASVEVKTSLPNFTSKTA